MPVGPRHLLGEELDGGSIRERERQRRERRDDLLHADLLELRHAFADPLRRPRERIGRVLLQRRAVQDAARGPSLELLEPPLEIPIVLADERRQAEGQAKGRRIPTLALTGPPSGLDAL